MCPGVEKLRRKYFGCLRQAKDSSAAVVLRQGSRFMPSMFICCEDCDEFKWSELNCKNVYRPLMTSVFGKVHRTPIGNCIWDGKVMGVSDGHPMEFPTGPMTGVAHIKFGGTLIYPKEVMYIYNVNPKFWTYLSVVVQ